MSRPSQKMSNEFILLGFIREQPMHGYDLYKLMNTDENISQIWYVKQAMLYAILDKLEEIGYLTSEMISVSNYPSRKQFSITERGEVAFQLWIEEPVNRPGEVRQEFLAKLYFAFRQSRTRAKDLLLKQKNICEQWLELHQQHISEAEDDPFSHFLLDFKQSQMQSIYEWILYSLTSLS